MKKNKLISIFIICMFSMIFVGCKKEEEAIVTVEIEEEEVNMFGLTETEQKIYAEYAAGVLMKYNAGSNMRILEGRKLEKQTAEEEVKREQEAKRQQAIADYEANKGSSSNKQETADTSSGNSENFVSYISDMSEATGNSDFSIYYTGCEVTDSYPESGDDFLLSVDASQGKVLLVTKFSVVNIGQETQNFDMFSEQPSFKLNINGTRYKAQYTLLLEDLAMYKGDIDAGATVDTVLLFEIPEAEASNLSDMELSVSIGNNVSLMELDGSGVSWTEVSGDAQVEEADVEMEENAETEVDTETEEMYE